MATLCAIDFVGSAETVLNLMQVKVNHSLELGSGQFIPGFLKTNWLDKAGDEAEAK